MIDLIKDAQRVSGILRSIEKTSSKLDKESLIVQNSNDELFKSVLKFLYNPYVKTNISTKKYDKDVDMVVNELLNVYDYMNYLSKSTGTNKNIATVKTFVNTVVENSTDKENVEWLLKGMACKNIKVGITSTTINKALGKGFVPKFDIMLAEKWIDYDKKKDVEKENWREYEGKEVIATLKIDGNRAECFVREDGSIHILSREGNVIDGCVEIEDALSNLERGYIYEGELLALNEDGLNANDLFKKTSSILRSKGVKTGLEFVVFDIIPIDQFENDGKSTMHTVDRKNLVEKILQEKNNTSYLRYLKPLYYGIFDKKILDDIAEEVKGNGEEGLMVQLANVPYEAKRTKNILKYKTFESADIKCVDVYEGITGKNIGRLGGIICEYKGSLVKIGGGFSEQQRVDYWNDSSKVIGKIVEVKYFEEFISDTGSYDLRFATFKDIRLDKTKESYF